MTPHPVRPDRVVSAISIAIAALAGPSTARCNATSRRQSSGVMIMALLEECRAANRLLWIQFTGPWCPNCTRMEQDSFFHPAIIEHSAHSFLPVKLRSDLNEQLVAALGLTGHPGDDCRDSEPRHRRLPPGLSRPRPARRAPLRLPGRNPLEGRARQKRTRRKPGPETQPPVR